jgi:hypothetical protein
VRFATLCLFFGLFGLSSGLYFHIGETERKCFIEEIPDETMVTGTYVNSNYVISLTGTYVMILEYFRQKKLAKKLKFLNQNKAKLFKILIITLVFVKTPFFRRKLSKIAENCDHNIGP